MRCLNEAVEEANVHCDWMGQLVRGDFVQLKKAL